MGSAVFREKFSKLAEERNYSQQLQENNADLASYLAWTDNWDIATALTKVTF